jgi:hypothetical protein
LLPAGETLGNGVDLGDAAFGVGGDDAVADRAERDEQLLLVPAASATMAPLMDPAITMSNRCGAARRAATVASMSAPPVMAGRTAG